MGKMEIYNRLPVWGQNLACYYEGSRINRTRYGKDFWRFLKEYESRANWSYEQLCDYRDARLRKMIHHCYETVPYYTRLFNDGGISPDSIKRLDDLGRLPILTKETVKNNLNEFVSNNYDINKSEKCFTGGTTGTGFMFYKEASNISEQWAVWWKYRRALGIDFDDMCGNFCGKLAVPSSTNKPPYWRENLPCRQIMFDEYHLNETTTPLYVEAIRKYKIHWLHGYASNISRLAAWMNNIGLTCDMKFVTTGGDNLYSFQMASIKKAFGVEPRQHYGAAEAVANFSQDIAGTISVDEDFAAVEFIPSQSEYKIIGTTLTNYAMPFLRFDTGDLVSDVMIPNNNLGGRVVGTINGREASHITLKNGGVLGEPAYSLIFEFIPNIIASQLVQTREKNLVFRIVKNAKYSCADEKRLHYEIRNRLGDKETYELIYVSDIEKTKSGKLRPMIVEQ